MDELEKFGIPKQYRNILNTLLKAKIDYVLIKQSPYLNQKISGLDILFNSNKDYKRACNVLLNNGFMLYLSEKNEPYKKMMVCLEKDFLVIMHLHRKISWYGIKALDSAPVFKRAKKLNRLIIVPSDEDSLLIHIAHVLFENHKITKFEFELLKELFLKNIDWNYLKQHVKNNYWEKQFYEMIDSLKTHFDKSWKKQKTIFKKTNTMPVILKQGYVRKTFLLRCFKKDVLINSWNLFIQAKTFVFRRITPRRGGLLITLIGPNGTGKTTISKTLAEKYKKLTKELILKHNYYYFGWVPMMPHTKLFSKFLIKGKKQIYKQSLAGKPRKFNLFLELLFVYVFIEDLLRYLFHVFPRLWKREMVVCDRYFYHIFGQYPYAINSRVLPILIKIFPKPDKTFLLTAELSVLAKRRKLPKEQLQDQLNQYLKLKKYLVLDVMKSQKSIDFVADNIIKATWKKMINRLSV